MVINVRRNTNRVHCNPPESVEDQFGPCDIPYDDKTSNMFLYIENIKAKEERIDICQK